MNIVPRQNTRLSREAATRAVRDAWTSVLGGTPSADELALVLALVWVETGAGASCQNWNLGNITAGATWPGDAWRPPWFDEPSADASVRTRELHTLMLKGQAPSAFRAYPSIEAGARDLMVRLERDFPEVLDAARTGNPDAFREALSRRYSRDYANPDATATFSSIMKQFGGTPKAKAPGAGSAGLSSSAPPLHSSPASLPTLRVGAHGPAVDLLRAVLERLQGGAGYAYGTPYSTALKESVKRYQEHRGIDADGEVGARQTWPALIEDLRRSGAPSMPPLTGPKP